MIVSDLILACIFTVCIINTILLAYIVNKLMNPELEVPEDHPEIDADEYMNSLDFNMLLDDRIQPLLGKYKNEEIVDRVIKSFDKNDPVISLIDVNALRSYISDVLLNYNNNYKEEEYEFESYDNDEIVEYYKKGRVTKTAAWNNTHSDQTLYEVTGTVSENIDGKTINLSNTLNNFYND